MDPITYFYIGMVIIFATHIYMLFNPEMNNISGRIHALINLMAAFFLVYYFMFKQATSSILSL